jgi:hypothetical protein
MRVIVIAIVLGYFAASAAAAPEIHVDVSSLATGIDDTERTGHVDAIRRAMREAIRDASIEIRHVDVCVTKLVTEIAAERVDISVELKVVVSTADDRIRSVGSGTAVSSTPRRAFRIERLPALRRQALGDALEGLQHRLRAAVAR